MLLHEGKSAPDRRPRSLAVSAAEAFRANRNDILTAFSLANLCFINAWYLAEQIPSASLNYYRKSPADTTLIWATLASVALLGLAFWTAWRLVVIRGNPLALRLARGSFLIILSYPVEKLIQYLSPPPDRFSYGAAVSMIALETTLLMSVMLVVLFDNRALLRIARRTTMVLALLFPSLAINLVWAWAAGAPAGSLEDRPLAKPVANRQPAASRVLWLVFDEFDQGLAFDYRPSGVRMPALDRLIGAAFHADHVVPTARWTMLAMPALIAGRPLSRSELLNASDLRIWPDDAGQPVNWREQPNIFSRQRAAGRNAAMIGWHHPYCRVVNESVSNCFWVPSEQGSDEIETEFHCKRIGLLRSVLFLLEWKAEDVLSALNVHFESRCARDVQQSLRMGQLQRFRDIRDHAMEAVANPELDLVVVHWPTPHPYGIYDRARRDFAARRGLTYLDNLELVDRTVAEILQQVDRAGLAGKTTVLVSSDHPFRREMWQEKFRWGREMLAAVNANRSDSVPFVIRFCDDAKRIDYHRPFNAILTTRIVEMIVNGEIRSGARLAAWLDANRS